MPRRAVALGGGCGGHDLLQPGAHARTGLAGPIERASLGEVFEDAFVYNLGIKARGKVVERGEFPAFAAVGDGDGHRTLATVFDGGEAVADALRAIRCDFRGKAKFREVEVGRQDLKAHAMAL